MKTFEEAMAITPRADGTFGAEVPDGWQQGRGAFGGLVLGLLLRAMEHGERDPGRRVRTVSGEICGPVMPGAAELRVTPLRRGSSASFWDAQLLQQGEVLARASATLSAARKVESRALAPASPPLDALHGLEPIPVGPPLGPAFATAFEYRSPGPFPFSGAERAEAFGSVRLRTPPARFDAPTLIAYADAWWPAWLSTVTRPRGAATIQFTAELLVDPATLDPSEPLVHVGRMYAERDGYFVELRELWRGSALVALNQQTFAILS